LTTVRRRPQGTVAALVAAACAAVLGACLRLLWRGVRTTPGLFLILCGASCVVARHPWIGLGIAGIGALIYRTQCYRTPYTRCQRCAGVGHLKPRRARARIARRCWACHGKGVRIRWGRAVMNAWRRATYTPRTNPDAAYDARPARPAGPITYTDALRGTPTERN